MKAKNPGLKAHQGALQAAADAKGEPDSKAPFVPLSLRLPKPLYDDLLRITMEAKLAGIKFQSLHALMLEGIEMVIAARLRK